CARCHGEEGQGTPKHKEPLAGNRSVAQLARVIERTMPEDKPKSLSPEQATQIAAYMYDAFYSVAARERRKPPRIELARLTVRQYRHTVADLLGNSANMPRLDERRGLSAEYYKNRRFRGEDRVERRVDPQVHFEFGTDTPLPGKTEPHEFSMRWNGSLLAPVTGEYELRVRTEHAARLWLNDMKTPLIDAWVKSGNDTEYKASIFLLAGRAYPVRLEYSKAKQGVDDSKKGQKPPAVKSSIKFDWKLPRRAFEPVPERSLYPNSVPETFVVATPFPPDDRSYGWERGTAVTKEWDQATTEAALETASYVASHLDVLAGTRSGAADFKTKARDYCLRFAERAFRRPLNADEKKIFVERQFEAAGSPEQAVKRVVLLVLKSPRFLYREVQGGTDGYDVAARLSFGLWDSLPDAELLAAAAAGQLATEEQVARQAERMLADPRAKRKLREFLITWLHVDHAADIGKDSKKYPGFDATLVADLRTSLELLLDEAIDSKDADLRQLFLGEEIPLNGRLAGYYGVDLPADAGFRPVKLDAGQRAGVLTHPYVMAAFAYSNESSPIHRGVFLARGILGLSLRPPPEAFTPLPANLHPKLTTRERVTLQTRPAACIGCHGIINPLGFTLEHFDAVGRFRQQDNARPVDAGGTYQTQAGKTVSFKGARELARFLADSPEVHDAFVEQMFHHLVQQSMQAHGSDTREKLRRELAAGNFNMRKLAVAVLRLSARTPRAGPASD
ncbi:MAG: DUF1592 domain-containing protein, partial [Gemmataceae bacterium]